MAAPALVGVAVAALLGPAPGWPGLAGRLCGAAVLVAAWAVVRRVCTDEREDPSSPWVWLARAALAVGGTAGVVALGEAALGAPTAAVEAVRHLGAAAGGLLTYQGVTRWSRFRVGVVAPQDWINGTAALLAATAVLHLVAMQAGIEVPSVLPVLALAASLLVLGAMASLAHLAGLRTDARYWMTFAAFLAISGAQVAAAVRADLHWLPLVVWSAAGATAILWRLVVGHVPRGRRHPASAAATATGSVVVLVSSILVVVGEQAAGLTQGLQGPGSRAAVWPALLAGTAAIVALVRLAAMVRDRSLLSISRVEALTDDLTGLGNRRALVERLSRVAGRTSACLVLVDLDDFKAVNDRYGHPVGDELLRTVARCLARVVPREALATRIGGDEFAVVVEGELGHAHDVAGRVAHALQHVSLTPVGTTGVRASIGLAAGGTDPEDLLWRADVALYAAKAQGGTTVVYDATLGAAAHERRRTADELVELLADPARARAQLVVWYQPQLEARTSRVTGVEALVRWEHPERGLLGPSVFLDVVEETGLMYALTDHVLGTACEQGARWASAGTPLRVAVNVAPSVLADERVLGLVDRALSTSDLPAAALVVEMTEAAVAVGDASVELHTRALRDRGVALSIDDYGTGYSSLSRLHELPVTEIKLDRRFTLDLHVDERARTIVAATIGLAHELGHRVVAEGVEDLQTLALLTSAGCDEVQGWVHARAMPPEAVTTWLAGRRTSVAPLPPSA